MSAPMENNWLLKAAVETVILASHVICFLIFLAPPADSTNLPSISPDDIAQITKESCIFAATETGKTDSDNDDPVAVSSKLHLNNILQEVQNIFKDEPSVLIGKIDIGFDWTDGNPLKWEKSSQTEDLLKKDLVFFPKKHTDRTCLLKSKFYKQNPEAEYFVGSRTVETITQFINNQCGTFRLTSGKLSQAGINKQDILNNLFHVENVSDMTMSQIYSTLNNYNPFNQSYFYLPHTSCPYDTEVTNNKKCTNVENRSVHTKEYKKETQIHSCKIVANIPSQNEFFNEYLKISKPVIFKGAIKEWALFTKWSNAFLRSEFGENEVHIKLTPGGDYEGVEKADLWENYETFKIPDEVMKNIPYPDLVVVRPATMNLKFSEFLDIVEYVAEQKQNERNLSAYLEYSSIPQYMPDLENDIGVFPFVSRLLTRRHLNLWLSDGHTLGRLHFDQFDNLLCQISGKKQVILFEPYDNQNLYEGHIPQATLSYNHQLKKFSREKLGDSTSMVMSPIDILNPDFERFPKFADVRPLNCTIEEGDVLFMPSFWWHEVQSFPSVTEKRNLAVNFWYEPFLTKEFPCPECKLDVNPFYHHLL